jgi:hypothetical protein
LTGQTERSKGTKLWVLDDGAGTPSGVRPEAAPPSKVKLAEATPANVKVRTRSCRHGRPERLIGDRGYDGNTARARRVMRGMKLPILKRCNGEVARYQGGRKPGRYKRRRIIGRNNS